MHKTLFISLFLTLFFSNAFCQKYPKVDVEVSTFRLGTEVGYRPAEVGYTSYQILPAAGLGLSIAPKSRITLGFRRLPARLSMGTGFSSANMSCKGFELSTGYERKVVMNKKFSFLPEIGLFADYARLSGVARTDYSEVNEINHKRLFYGSYLALKFSYAITPSVKVVLGSRIDAGYMQSKASYPTYPNENGRHGDYKGFFVSGAVISSSLRITLH